MNRRITSTLIVLALIASSTLAGCSSKADPAVMKADCFKMADILGAVLDDLSTINDGFAKLNLSAFDAKRADLADQEKRLSDLKITDGILADDVKKVDEALKAVIVDLNDVQKSGPAAIKKAAADIDHMSAAAERASGSCL